MILITKLFKKEKYDQTELGKQGVLCSAKDLVQEQIETRSFIETHLYKDNNGW